MLAHRIIPTILCRGRQLVKGKQFDSWRSVGLAMQAIQIHALRGVDEICLLDVSATAESRGPDLDLVRELSDFLFAPLAVGGGVHLLDDVKDLLRAGADKVVIGSAAWNPVHDLLRDASAVVGSQALVVSIDVRADRVFFRNGTRPASVMNPDEVCQWMQRRGAGEILLQSIERDGMCQGYDLELIQAVASSVNIPVIASGGCGSYEDMRLALEAGASAVAAGAMFQFQDTTPRGAAQYLQAAGFEVRL